MFWKMAGLSATSPIDTILDKSSYTLEELLDEERIIQECKAGNSRLVNFLRGKPQVKQMLHYIIDEAPEGADSKRAFKYPFVSCQIFTCDIDAIMKTLVENQELLDLLFAFLNPNTPHGTLLSGYFSKVVLCLLKVDATMDYLNSHEEIFTKMVDLIGITSIKEVLFFLVGCDDDQLIQWLASTNFLEMLVDKLGPENTSEVHANASETLSAIMRTAPGALATQLASPRFVSKILSHALEDLNSKSALIHSLSVCISVLEPKSSGPAAPLRSPLPLDPVVVEAMLQRFGDLLRILDTSEDSSRLATTYGELRPPFGIHRLKIVEFVAALLRTNNESFRQELIRLQALPLLLRFFFEYPFNNMLHGYVEAIIVSIVDNGSTLLDNLFADCDFISRLLAANDKPLAPDTRPVPKHKAPPRVGCLGHLTRIANKIVQASATNSRIQNYLQSHPSWSQWQTSVLQQRNMLENVYHWQCGRPTAIRNRPVESDDEEFRERDYDVPRMASNLAREVFRYGMFDNDETEELPGTIERDDEEVFFDDETAEVVISSIRLSDDQDRFGERYTPAWLALQEDNFGLPSGGDDGEANLSSPSSSGSDDEVVVDDDNEFADTAASSSGEYRSDSRGLGVAPASDSIFSVEDLTGNAAFNLDYFPKAADWANFSELDKKEDFGENNPFSVNFNPSRELSSSQSEKVEDEETESKPCMEEAPVLSDGEPKILGVEPEGTAKAMEHALKEGIVGEAGPLKPKETTPDPAQDTEVAELTDEKTEAQEFNDVNYWRSDYEKTTVLEEQ